MAKFKVDSTSALSDNLYLLLKRDNSARPLLAPTVTASPDVDPYPEADIQPDRVSKRDQA